MRLTFKLFGRELLSVELEMSDSVEYVDNTALDTEVTPGEWTDRGEYEQIYEYPEEDRFRMGFAGGVRSNDGSV